MKFHCLLPVRDEADIIRQCLDHALKWADAIYVFDTGSVDDTWEVVQDLAKQDKRVLPLRKEPVYFSETRLRGWLFHHARQHMREGDWFLRVDADEFHHIPPPQFVREYMRSHETIAYHQYYDFRLTASEVVAWEQGRETLQDRVRPIGDRRRHYTLDITSEPRLCRYRSTMQWPPTVSFPFNAGYVAREKLPIRHYPHRDPVQLDRRCRLRAAIHADLAREPGSFTHWDTSEWRRLITPDDLPSLRFWKPGTDLPRPGTLDHLAPPHLRALQRFIHTVGLPVLDRLRPAYPENAQPHPLPPELVERLRTELRV